MSRWLPNSVSDAADPDADGRTVARAIDALRRGWPVICGDADSAVRILAIETADAEALAKFDGEEPADILIGAGRAETLKLANQREAATPAHRCAFSAKAGTIFPPR